MTSSVNGVSFIVPAYNEEEGINDTFETLDASLKKAGIDYEIIIVNDGSTDRTHEYAEKFSNATVISHPINAGYGRAIKTGIVAARYNWIGITDADGTYPMEIIPELLNKMKLGFDMIIAKRTNLKAHDSFLKGIFRNIYKKIIGILFNVNLKDPNSGLRIFSKNRALNYFPFLCNTYSFTTSLTLLFYGGGAFIDHIPIEYKTRYGKSKVHHIKDSINAMLLIIQSLTFYNPIRFFIFLSFCIITFVCFPAMLLAVFKMHTLSLYYLVFGSTMSMLIAVGILVDTVRISNIMRNHKKE